MAQRPDRVLSLIATNQRRGAEMFGVRLADHLAASGKDCTMLALAATSDSDRLDVPTLRSHMFSLPGIRQVRASMQKADVVIAHGSRTLPVSILAGLGLDVPIAYKNIGDPVHWGKTWARRTRTQMFLRRVTMVAALTPSAADQVHETWKVPTNKVFVTGGGRNVDHFTPPSTAQRANARASLGLDPDQPVVIFVGALSPEKRPDIVIEAARQLDQMVFVMAGSGALEAQLRAISAAMANVRLLGNVENTADLYHAADVLLLPSDSEGLPGVLMEAALSGVPAVATKVGFVEDLLVDGKTGYLAPRGDIRGLVAGVRDAVAAREQMSAASRIHAVQVANEADAFDRWGQLVEDLIQGTRGPRPPAS